LSNGFSQKAQVAVRLKVFSVVRSTMVFSRLEVFSVVRSRMVLCLSAVWNMSDFLSSNDWYQISFNFLL